jgi:hypothetical protein
VPVSSAGSWAHTPLVRKQVLGPERMEPRTSIRLVATNVLRVGQWRDMIRAADTDIILCVPAWAVAVSLIYPAFYAALAILIDPQRQMNRRAR